MRNAEKSRTRKKYESATNSIAKRGQGAIAPCRVKGQRPLWGLGQRPNCFSGAQLIRKKSTKGAGSEASLPVTLRSRRSAPKLHYPTSMQCRAKWARPDCLTSDHSWSFPQAWVSPLQRRRGGNENRRSLRSPFGNLRRGCSHVS